MKKFISDSEWATLIITPHDLQTQINQTDRMVYDLYGLTEEEIQIVEEGVGWKPSAWKAGRVKPRAAPWEVKHPPFPPSRLKALYWLL